MNFKKRVNGSWTDTPHYIYKTATDTITTLPADLYADGNSATIGLVGNMSQTGTPTPQSPIQPQETGERTENLFGSTFIEGYQLAINTGLPTPYAANNSRCAIETPIDVTNLNIVTFSFKNDTDDKKFYMYSLFNGDTLIERVANKTSGSNINVSSGTALYLCVYSQTASINAAQTISNIMLVEGSTAPSEYIPYGYKIPILSGGVITNIYIGDAPLRKSLDGSDVYDTIESDGTLTRRVDANGDALATPIVEQITVPPIPTLSTADTFDVLTSLKPSAVYLTYKGWHDATVKEWDGSEWQ